MKSLACLAVLICILFSSCNKVDNQPSECDTALLEMFSMVAYNGDINEREGCQDFLNKFQLSSGEMVYSPDCTCCDMNLSVFNCAGENICTEEGSCPGFPGATFVATIGIRE